jgi:preprotein translocase subunit SecE
MVSGLVDLATNDQERRMESVSSQDQQSTGYKRRSSGKRRRTEGTTPTARNTTVAVAEVAEESTARPAAKPVAVSAAERQSRAESKARAAAEAQAESSSSGLKGRLINTDRFEGLRRFIRDTMAEIRKVIWPDRETTRNLTLLVIALSLVLGLLLGGIDFILFELFEAMP